MKATNRYISYLDGLRGYAILFVLLGHFELASIYISRFGVTVFFFVSGFLITKLLIHEYENKGGIHLKDFYLRRVFRLYPALILMIGLCCVCLLIFGFRIYWADIMAGLFYFTNYYLVYFRPDADPHYFLVSNILWSLSVEEHFYLIFPLLFAFLYDRGRLFLHLLSFSLVLFLLIRLYTAWNADSSLYFPINYYTTHSRGDSIMYGCVSALLLYQFNTAWYIKWLQSKMVWALGLSLLVLSLAYRNPFFLSTFAYSLQGIGMFLLVPAFAFIPTSFWVSRLVNGRFIIFIGRLSYSLYLFHWVSLKIGNMYFAEKGINWFLIVVPLTAILSLGSFYLVEKPFLKLRKRFGSNVSA